MQLENRVAIVTGAGAGIGKAIALRYSCEGAKVIVAEIDSETGQAAADEIRGRKGEGAFIRTDVAKEADVRAMVEKTLALYGKIDILVNNAAILLDGKDRRLHELSNEVWASTLAVNLGGHFLCAKYVLPIMLKQGGGCIINLASPTGMRGFKDLTAYSTSKGAIIALTRAMAADYSQYHIRVNALVPGTTDTPMNATTLADGKRRKELMAMAPSGRLGTADDLAGMAVFLASDAADYCVGGFYMVDGGLTAV